MIHRMCETEPLRIALLAAGASGLTLSENERTLAETGSPC